MRRRLDEALQRLGRHLSAQLADPELVIDARQRMAPVYAGRAAAITARGEAGAYPTPSPLPTPERRGARFGGLMGALLGLLVGGGLLWDAQSAAMGAALGAFGGALADLPLAVALTLVALFSVVEPAVQRPARSGSTASDPRQGLEGQRGEQVVDMRDAEIPLRHERRGSSEV